MLHAHKAKRDDGVRLPAFVLESDNLDSYRPWLKRLREWTRKQGGQIMEAHLIGEEVPEEDLADAEAADADADVVGHRTEDGVGVEGGRRRQIRDPASYPMDQRVQAAARYAAEGMETLSVSTIIGMTTAQHTRYASVPTQSGAWRQREAELCDALNSVVEALVPAQFGKASATLVQGRGAALQWREFPGLAHSSCASEMEAVGGFLREVLEGQ